MSPAKQVAVLISTLIAFHGVRGQGSFATSSAAGNGNPLAFTATAVAGVHSTTSAFSSARSAAVTTVHSEAASTAAASDLATLSITAAQATK
jgi:hypothetical protein